MLRQDLEICEKNLASEIDKLGAQVQMETETKEIWVNRYQQEFG